MPKAPVTQASARLVALVEHALKCIADVDKKEEALTEAKALLDRIQRTDLPELLKELGMSDASLTELGVKVALSQGVEASIPEAVRPDAFAWLAEKGYGAIVRAEVTVAFGAAELEKAQECEAALLAKDYVPQIKMQVPAPTLKAWVKERMTAGDDIPPELFKVHSYDMAKITAIKKKK